MAAADLSLLVLSDFNTDLLCGYLHNDSQSPSVRAFSPGFGQVLPALADPLAACWQPAPDFALVWTRPEAVLPEFARLLAGGPASLDQMAGEVGEFARSLQAAAARVKRLFVASWTGTGSRLLGSAEMRPGVGMAGTLMKLNLQLAEQLDPNLVTMLNAQAWLSPTGTAWKRWYLAKIPFGNETLKAATAEIKAALVGSGGGARKVILLDLDETLWGGVVGDVGWQGLRLGGHDGVGEAFVDFQLTLQSLKNRGVLLGIVSKNDETVALEAMRSHPEMRLRPDDFVGWRINWTDKAQNVIDLMGQLNLGLDAAVFIDDNPVERARLREALPQVLVPEWPKDPLLYRQALENLLCFDRPVFSSEDARRTQLYAEEGERQRWRGSLSSLSEFVASLQTQVVTLPLGPATVARVAQLLNKTNQMNLRTRRLGEGELLAWAAQPGHQLHGFQVSDRFGAAGLTGIVGLRVAAEVAFLEDFVLSCRVMGRGVEEAMTFVACEQARAAGARQLLVEGIPTSKNQPCLDHWARAGFTPGDGPHRYIWDLTRGYPPPSGVTITLPVAGAPAG